MPSKGRCFFDQPIFRLGGASINYYLKVNYSVSDSLCLVSLPHDHGAPSHRDELYGLYRRLRVCVVSHEFYPFVVWHSREPGLQHLGPTFRTGDDPATSWYDTVVVQQLY